MSQLSVDTVHHVISDIKAYHADKKDNQYLQDITIPYDYKDVCEKQS